MTVAVGERLAALGGPAVVKGENPDLFRWPIVTAEDEQAVVQVLRDRAMSGTDITMKFEDEWGAYQGTKYNLMHCNGTASLLSAMFAVGLGRGDEMIVPSLTYWASALQCQQLGATPVFADIDPVSLTIDPADIERRITPRTRAIVAVHYCGHPCDMDRIMAIARKHHLKVIEDVSHAQGALYKGQMVGSIGDVAGISMMAGKSFACGEAGMLSTNSREIFERAVAFSHYERIPQFVTDPKLRASVVGKDGVTMPLGAAKGRVNQTCSAMARVQLKSYQRRIETIQSAMNRFWDLLEDVPGVRGHRPVADSGSTMGGWYNPLGHYIPEELGGLPVGRFIEAVQAEGGMLGRSVNSPIHLHPVVNDADIFHDGKPTRIAFSDRDLRQPAGSLPVTEALHARAFGVPWFKHDNAQLIEQYAAAIRKVANNYQQLLG